MSAFALQAVAEAPITGAMLVHAIEQCAAGARMPVTAFVRPLTTHPRRYLDQLREAAHPKPATIARVRALLAGDAVPPAANSFHRPCRPGAIRLVDDGYRSPPYPADQYVHRDPCFRCGTRRDLGCVHHPIEGAA